MNGKTWVMLGVAFALLLALAWQYGWLERETPQIAELKTLAAQPPTQERGEAVRDAIRQQVEAIPSDEGRRNYFEAAAPILIPMFAMQFETQYDAFMKMSSEEQRRELDKRIDEMEKRRSGGPAEAARPGGNRSPMDPKRADEMQKKFTAYTTPQQRAKFEDGIRRFNERREQRGLEPMPLPGRGGRPF